MAGGCTTDTRHRWGLTWLTSRSQVQYWVLLFGSGYNGNMVICKYVTSTLSVPVFTSPPLYSPSSLTTNLPFEDDEFDHVHVSMIATGVPENKVSITLYI